MRVQDKVAIVTGAAQGIGFVYAKGLAAEGAKVVLADIQEDKGQEAADLLAKEGYEARFVGVDIADEASTQALAEATLEAHGRIDILVNDAALFNGLKLYPLSETPLDYWTRVLLINLTGTWLMCKAVIPAMRAQGDGRIINQSSDAAYAIRNVYGVSKLGVVGVTTGLAKELAPFGIRVNCISPGPTLTETSVNFNPQMLEEMVSRIPMKRGGQPEEHVGALLWLASDESSFVTGQVICVDGGQVMRI